MEQQDSNYDKVSVKSLLVHQHKSYYGKKIKSALLSITTFFVLFKLLIDFGAYQQIDWVKNSIITSCVIAAIVTLVSFGLETVA